MKAKQYPNGALGSDAQTIPAMGGGMLDMAIATFNNVGAVKEVGALEFPFLFNSAEEVDFIMDGPVGQKLKGKLAEQGVVVVSVFEFGFRHYHTRKNSPIKTADDFKGKKLRVQPSPVYIDFVNGQGANAMPMNFAETYTALEQGTIDGMSNPLVNVLDGKFYEVTPNLTITNHIYQPSFLGFSKKVFDQLTNDERKIIMEAGAEASVYQRKLSREVAARTLDILKNEKKMDVYVLAPAELDKMRERAKPVIAKFTQSIGPDFVGELMFAIDRRVETRRLRLPAQTLFTRGTAQDRRKRAAPAAPRMREPQYRLASRVFGKALPLPRRQFARHHLHDRPGGALHLCQRPHRTAARFRPRRSICHRDWPPATSQSTKW